MHGAKFYIYMQQNPCTADQIGPNWQEIKNRVRGYQSTLTSSYLQKERKALATSEALKLEA